ncbi:hypothetical protein QNJ95_44105 [Bradyrhizobium elkanii]|uniref:hypothetical protein n=1 Tax=Bradyrhizobium elkanii TaxID=29448 RepID=UPI0027122027|nr:hypothetical protein [Bradyrhizobium elkanii]WLA39746.1 hypothetical protein QNJ95_44105 [Bradyrhizobium elkanii]
MTADEATKLLDNLVESLAAIEHERWSHWQRYMHGKATKQIDGSLLIPPNLVRQWERQLQTRYADLSEKEKESDREQVRKYLPVIAEALSQNI